MKKDWKSINPFACLMLLGSLAYALYMVWRGLATSGWESIAVLLLLGLLMSWHVLNIIPQASDLPYRMVAFDVVVKRPAPSRNLAVVTKLDTCIAWVFLGVFAVTALIPYDITSDWRFAYALWFLLLAPSCYLLGCHYTLLLAGPLFIFLVVLPLHESLFLIISQPLRLLATMCSVEGLRLCGVDVTYNLTTITLPDVELGITDACSGIQQFEALLLLGYILVRWMQTGLGWGILHYAFIFSSVVIANIIRLMVIVVLFNSIGPRVLAADWHEGMGYVQVVLTIFFLWLFGRAINLLSSSDTSAAPANGNAPK